MAARYRRGRRPSPPPRPADRLAAQFGGRLSTEERGARRFELGGFRAWDLGYRVHNVTVLPERPDRAYVAYTSAGAYVLDLSDRRRPRVVGALDYGTTVPGAAHTCVPLGTSGFALLSDETLDEAAADYPQNVWVVDCRLESRPVIVGLLELPWPEAVPTVGRFGAHNLHEYAPGQASPRSFDLGSFDLVAASLFGMGTSLFDVSDPFRPRNVGRLSPGPEAGGVGCGQLNDVFVDDRSIAYTVDRGSDLCYLLALDGG